MEDLEELSREMEHDTLRYPRNLNGEAENHDGGDAV